MDRSLASLDGKVAIVTGSGGGIGKGIALGLATFGAAVSIVDKNPETAAATAKEFEGLGHQALAFTANVGYPDQVKSMVKATLDRFGKIDILVNNAGGTFKADFLDTSEKGWDTLIRANLKSVFHCTKAVADEMIKRKTPGAIVTVTSIEAWRAAPGYGVYSACKAGLENFTQTMALELAPHGIRVNSIAPNWISTPGLNLGDTPEDQARWRRSIPLQRLGYPGDMAGTAVFLASEMSAFITGITVHVDGGCHAANGWLRDKDMQWVTAM